MVGAMDENYDVVVVGGGAAGLSGAVALARSRLSVLVVAAGEPRNAPASHVHNFLTRDGTPPAEIYAAGRAEVTGSGGGVEAGRVTTVRPNGDGFTVELADRTVGARRILIATGARDELPDIPGLAAGWGSGVVHCPYCHGWEIRDQRIGVLATGPAAVHQALLFRQLSRQVTLLAHVSLELGEQEREQLAALGVPVVEGAVAEVEYGPEGLAGVRLVDGRWLALDARAVAPGTTARVDPFEPLGLELVELRRGDMLLGQQIDADATGATKVPGVWVAGNAGNVQAQVVTSAAAGLAAGAAINGDLIAEDAQRAVHEWRFERVYGEQAWDERYRATGRNWSGNPNPVLITEVAELSLGTALDAGCGEGADACWLAARGWQVTGADFAATALARAAELAEQAGVDVNWLHLDLSSDPAPRTYDLVTSHFLHLPGEQRQVLFRHLAEAVAPGGTLLIVGHDPDDPERAKHRPELAEMAWTADEVAESIGPGWVVEVAESRPRPAADPDGRHTTTVDVVVRARRAPGQDRP